MRALRAWTDELEPIVVESGGVNAQRTSLLSEEQRVSLAAVLSADCLDEPIGLTSGSVERIRQTVAVLRASEERVESRLAELKVENQRLQACLQAAEAQTESAEAMISFQAARADAAEQRSRDIETKFVRMLNDLADELELTGFEGVNSAQTDCGHSLKL
jgi:phage shock protein A